MRQSQHRATEVAKTLSRFIKADLAEDLSLAMIKRKFPGMSERSFCASSLSAKTRRPLNMSVLRSWWRACARQRRVMPPYSRSSISGARTPKNTAA